MKAPTLIVPALCPCEEGGTLRNITVSDERSNAAIFLTKLA